MAEKSQKCNNKNGCDGFINEKACTFVQTDWMLKSPVFACDKCDALHSRNGGHMVVGRGTGPTIHSRNGGHMAAGRGTGPTIFWKNGEITDEKGNSPY